MYKQIHIVGCSPRSGTTLLHEAMITCFVIDKHYEHEKRFNHTQAIQGQTLVSKRPKDTQFMPSVLKLIPHFWVIYLLRDPRDVIVSKHARSDQYYSNIRLWREQHEYATRMLDHPRFHLVKYENLVQDPNRVQHDIMKKIPWLVKRHDFSDYHLHASVSESSASAMHGVRPISPTSLGQWKENLSRLKKQIDLHGSLTPDLIRCKYEEDNAWESILDDVEAAEGESFYPEKLHLWDMIRKTPNIYVKTHWYRFKRNRSK
ncbi:MAG: sulfotransferase [Planctomycetota bacterium]|nr:sulfotransferase [Planctomycetota bacterium]